MSLPEPPWLPIARRELGTAEVPGDLDNPRILEYLRTVLPGTSSLHDETSWCSAYVNWCMIEANLAGTANAAAKSWLRWGVGLGCPVYGCVTVLWRDSRKSWKGHVGFLTGIDPKLGVQLLAGNQGNTVSEKWFPQDRVLAYRMLGA